MTERVPEQLLDQLSAFLDAELSDSESELLVRRFGRDAELREAAARYTLIGEIMRDPARAWLADGVRRRVAASLADAPELPAAPAASAGAWSRWSKPAIGVAVAAGVAVVAVLSLQPESGERLSGEPLASQREAPSFIEPETYTVPRPALRLPATAPARLTNYAVLHSEYSTMGGRTVLTGIIADEPAELTEPEGLESR